MACPDPETFELLFSGVLPAPARATVADHAATCDECRRLIEVLLEPAVAQTIADDTGGRSPAIELGFALRPGDRVDRYIIERRIGQGAMGVVYAAHDPDLGRAVAIKVLRAGASGERLRREAQSLARLSHPNAVAVHDVGEHDHRTFIAMALVDGDNLRRWLETPRSIDEVLRVVREAGRGIAAAHAAGLVHRDLKPDNIFVAHDGAVLVGDFGLARAQGDVSEERAVETAPAPASTALVTETGMIVGTPAYMAPEQATGAATTASDQFAFCVTIWEALYGARPFAGGTLTALREAIAGGEIAPPPADRAVPPPIEAALRRGLAIDPGARHASIEALLAALVAPPPPKRRRAWLLAGAGVLAAGAVVVSAIALHAPATAPPPPPDPAVAAACDRALPADDRAGTIAPALATALDAYRGSWLAARATACTTRADPATLARLACLDDRHASVQRVTGELAAAEDVQGAVQALDRLPPLSGCAAATTAPAPAEVALSQRLAVVETMSRIDKPVPLADVVAIAADADARHADIALVRALVLEGELLQNAWASDQAEAPLRRALAIAERTRDDGERVRASLVLVRVLSRLQRTAEAGHVLDDATAVLARIGNPPDVVRELDLSRATILAAAGDHAGAIVALEAYTRSGAPDDTTMVLAYTQIGSELQMANRATEASEAYAHARAVSARLGITDDDDPIALSSTAEAAMARGDFAHGIAAGERVMAFVMANPHTPEQEALFLANLGGIYEVAGAWVALRDTRKRELALRPDTAAQRPDRAFAMESLGSAELRLGDAASAVTHLREAIAIAHAAGPKLADDTTAKIALGVALVRTGKFHEARTLLEPFLPELVAADPPRPWRVATASDMLARALWEDGDERARGRARSLAADAERAYIASVEVFGKLPGAATSLGVVQGRLAELRAWRTRHP